MKIDALHLRDDTQLPACIALLGHEAFIKDWTLQKIRAHPMLKAATWHSSHGITQALEDFAIFEQKDLFAVQRVWLIHLDQSPNASQAKHLVSFFACAHAQTTVMLVCTALPFALEKQAWYQNVQKDGLVLIAWPMTDAIAFVDTLSQQLTPPVRLARPCLESLVAHFGHDLAAMMSLCQMLALTGQSAWNDPEELAPYLQQGSWDRERLLACLLNPERFLADLLDALPTVTQTQLQELLWMTEHIISDGLQMMMLRQQGQTWPAITQHMKLKKALLPFYQNWLTSLQRSRLLKAMLMIGFAQDHHLSPAERVHALQQIFWILTEYDRVFQFTPALRLAGRTF